MQCRIQNRKLFLVMMTIIDDELPVDDLNGSVLISDWIVVKIRVYSSSISSGYLS